MPPLPGSRLCRWFLRLDQGARRRLWIAAILTAAIVGTGIGLRETRDLHRRALKHRETGKTLRAADYAGLYAWDSRLCHAGRSRAAPAGAAALGPGGALSRRARHARRCRAPAGRRREPSRSPEPSPAAWGAARQPDRPPDPARRARHAPPEPARAHRNR
ncbi:MAG: hypothetical protein R3F11_14495 [Verrucomicrobiales bacterium]